MIQQMRARRLRGVLLLALSLTLGWVAVGCVPVSDGGSDAPEEDAGGGEDVGAEDAAPTGPVTLTLSPSTVRLERRNDSGGSPKSHADLCISDYPDPRLGVELQPGTPCVDWLIMRFAVPGSGGDATVAWSPNFTNVVLSAGEPGAESRTLQGVPTDGREIMASAETVPNLLRGGERVKLSFTLSLRPQSEGSVFYELTIATVEVTPL